MLHGNYMHVEDRKCRKVHDRTNRHRIGQQQKDEVKDG